MAQPLEFEFQQDAEITVCGSSQEFETKIFNSSGSEITTLDVLVELPNGITYISSSFTDVLGSGLTITPITSSEFTVSIPSLSTTDSVAFIVDVRAEVGAIDFQEGGGVFRNDVSYSWGGEGYEEETSSYNILYPALTITNITPTSTSKQTGESVDRTITISNAGFGKTDQIVLTNLISAGAFIQAVDIGTLSGGTITISGADFSSIGNGDSFFDSGETIIITETIMAEYCGTIVSNSQYNVAWGCYAEEVLSESSYASIDVDFNKPNINISTKDSLSYCLGDGVGAQQEVSYVNTGSGYAVDLIIDIYKSTGGSFNNSILSGFDPESIQVKIASDGTWFTPSLSASTLSSASCAGSGSLGRFEFNIAELAPGDTVTVRWDMISCGLTCSNNKVDGWRTSISYTDACDEDNYSKDKVGQNDKSKNMSVFSETPAEINEGISEDFIYTVSSLRNDFLETESSAYRITFELHDDLTYDDLKFTQNGAEWDITVSYDPGTNVVVGTVMMPEPFVITKSEIILSVTGNCGSTGWKDINMNISYLMDTDCDEYPIPMVCDYSVEAYLECPFPECEGLNSGNFTVLRTSMGDPDNDLNGIPDASGDFNYNKVKLNRAMVGDTINVVHSGYVHSSSGSSWSILGNTITNNEGTNLSWVSSQLEYYNAAAGITAIVPFETPTESSSGTDKEFVFTLTFDDIVELYPSLSGSAFSDGDSVKVSHEFKLISSVTGNIKETLWEGELYVQESISSAELGCGVEYEKSTFIGYSWRNDSAGNYTVNSCSRNVRQNFGLSIGDCCSNYAGGNLFPYEYRYWGHIKEAFVVIPDGYTLQSNRFRFYRTTRTNVRATQTINNIPVDAYYGDTLYFDLEQYYLDDDVYYSDDGFHGFLDLELAPECDVPQDNYEPIEYIFTYSRSTYLGGGSTGNVIGPNDQIRYKPGTLSVSAVQPKVDVITKNVSWVLKVKNTSSSGVDNAWIHMDPPSNINITSITYESSGSAVTELSDLYTIGSISGGATKKIVIAGELLNCDTASFDVYAGYECTAYPSSFEDFNCTIYQTELYVEPKPSDYQVRVFSNPIVSDFCSQFVEVGVDVSSVKIGHIYDTEITFVTGGLEKITVVPDSSMFKYNMSSDFGFISDPILTGMDYDYQINNYDSGIENNGIPGVLDMSNNRFMLKTYIELGSGFTQGDFLQIEIATQNACSNDLPTKILNYDPQTKFVKDNTAGLHLSAIDSWSAAWGDFDNDGYDDLFIPNKDHNGTNQLYRNNGDGTFEAYSAPPLTSDLGEAVAASWADYDNDGDLDLFVAYNTYSVNKLYENQGDGTFTIVEDDVIATEGLYSHSVSWADYDRDGLLDIVITDIHASHYNKLLKENSDGSFSLVEDSEVSMLAASSVGVAWGDFDNDLDLDLFIANTNGENNSFFENVNGVMISRSIDGLTTDGGHSVGAIWGDYDNDLDLDLYVTNASDLESNFLYTNNGDGTFSRLPSTANVEAAGNSHGCSWMDYDNDGDLDLVVANNLGNENFVYSNNGDGTFTALDNAISEETSDSYGVSWSDYDLDGDLDLYVANHGSSVNDFFINQKGACNNFIGFDLRGCNSNASGVGTKIEVLSIIGGVEFWQKREISSQTGGLGGQSSMKLVFGLRDANSVDSVIIYWPSGIKQVLSGIAINDYHIINEDCGGKLCGYVFNDLNENGVQDSGEIGVSGQKVLINPGAIETYTNEEGYFQAYVYEGSYSITFDETEKWSLIAPLSPFDVEVDLSSSAEFCENDFAVKSNCEEADLQVNLGMSAFRRGLLNDVQVSIQNASNFEVVDYQLELKMSKNIFMVGDSIELLSEETDYRIYQLNMGSIGPFSDTMLTLLDSVEVGADLDEFAWFEVKLLSTVEECDSTNNFKRSEGLVVGSIDPNDKLVFVQGKGKQQTFSKGDTLVYMIRFENVGNYAARRVLIKDTLSTLLDWSTFEPLESSHPFTTSISNGVVSWVNNNIELPDSTTDKEGSQGYVMFRIRAKKDLDSYTPVLNSAAIQFDYNEFILTNQTEIIYNLNPEQDFNVFMYPNPTQEFTVVKLLNDEQIPLVISQIEMFDLSGKMCYSAFPENKEHRIQSVLFEPGVYIIAIKNEEGEQFSGKLIIL